MQEMLRENCGSNAMLDRGGMFLTFFLDQEEYGIEILTVREIIGIMPITPVPQTPAHVRGIINLRGRVIPVVDLRSKFGMAVIDDTDETCVVVVQTGGTVLGLVVDSVSEVLDVPPEEIVDPPTLGAELRADHLLGIGKHEDRVTLLLDIAKVFPAVELGDLDALI